MLTPFFLLTKYIFQTAERLAKNAEASSVAKDAQIKRATEAVARMKAQLAELKSNENTSGTDDRARAEAAEARVRVLEKQRAELVAAFKKQMKLVDVSVSTCPCLRLLSELYAKLPNVHLEWIY